MIIERLKESELKVAIEDLTASHQFLMSQSRMARIGQLTASLAFTLEKPIKKSGEILIRLQQNLKRNDLRELQSLSMEMERLGSKTTESINGMFRFLKEGFIDEELHNLMAGWIEPN